ncbi:MAG: cyclic nucleotide-binding domain-containing protein [Spirochaetes bacterium]|nr:cyclic nucleotide-binding domain-containing protein [Spirochaetota bacterium]
MQSHSKKTFKKGSYIYIEGDDDVDDIYIVQSGEIALETTNKKVVRFRINAEQGEVFGLISSLSDRPRMESAYAKTDSVILIFNRESFLALLSKNADIAMKVINSFADELRAYDDMIFSIKARRENVSDDMMLFGLGEYFYRQGELSYACYVYRKFLSLYPESSSCDEAKRKIGAIEKKGQGKMSVPRQSGVHLAYANKQIVFCENEPGDALYLIKEGKVKIFKNVGDSQIMLSILKKGDIFGELAIVSNKTRNATAVCDGTTILIPITKENLVTMLGKSPMLLKKIYTAISERLWFTYIRIESRLYEKPITRIYAFLENKLMEEKIPLKGHDSYIFNFGIDELLKMTDITLDELGDSINELLQDHNLNFNFGETSILRASDVAARAKYFKSRDRLDAAEPGETAVRPSPQRHETEPAPSKPETPGPSKAEQETTILFSEMSQEIDGE